MCKNEKQQKLSEIVYIDPVTALPNRTYLYECLTEFFKKNPNKSIAILYIDVDNFKYISNIFGYSFSEKTIKYIAEKLISLLDSAKYIYRLGNDEFIIIINNFNKVEEIEECAISIIQGFQGSFQIESSTFHINLSIGIALYPQHGKTNDELIKCAYIAAQQGKKFGKNKYIFYKETMLRPIHHRMSIEKHLRSALDNNEFKIYYQPQLDLITGEICGFEALIRWDNPELGMVSPLEFINIAEDTFLIIPIGEWVLRNACYFLKKIHNQGHSNLTISVNVSVLQLLQDNFTDNVINLLDYIGLNPKYLDLEVTESILKDSYSEINIKLKCLRNHGVRISLDDFGKGYSSLSELQNLSIDTLKIDKTFIDMISSKNSKKTNKDITEIIIAIGHKMEMTVLAEGVETEEQLDFLKKNNCDKIQGYLVSRPLPEEEILEFLPNKLNTNSKFREFIWKDEYSVNVSDIDMQHRRLFEIGYSASKLAFSSEDEDIDCYNEIELILSELKDYAEYHFSYEEQLMEKHGYVHFKTHKNEHFRFIRKIKKFKTDHSKSLDRETLIELIDFIFLWITNHIMKSDMKYKDFFNNIGII